MEPIELILSKLPDVRKVGNGWNAKCPAHDDQNPSLSISAGDDGRVLLRCHAECTVEDICKTMQLRVADLFPQGNKDRSRKRITATYDYRDEDGAMLFQVVRYHPKSFRQRRPDGNGGWIWSLGTTPRVLYRLPELIAAPPDAWVFIVEGEKDVDSLVERGAVATTCPQGAGKWKELIDDGALNNRRVVLIADRDRQGQKHVEDIARRLQGRVLELRLVELPGTGKDVSDWFAAGGTMAELQAMVIAAPPYVVPEKPVPPPATDSRETILIDTEEHRVISHTIQAMAADPDVFQRGGILVRVLRSLHPRDGIVRSRGSATTNPLPAPNLRERMTRVAAFTRNDRDGEPKSAHPPTWLVNAIRVRGDWNGIRYLMGVSDTPVLRADGSIWQTAGYDTKTCVLYEPDAEFPTIPDDIGVDCARAAARDLLSLVGDFRFEKEEHKSAWLAGLLTPLARFAFQGPTPLFLIDANVRGAGKGLLAQTIASVVLGREMPVSSYAHDSEEMRKKITAISIAGDRMVLFDNVEGAFGNDTLDRALTTTRWKDRILGKSQDVELPLIPTWYATGNNVQVSADTTRRIIHIRLDVLEEHPEDRTDFQQKDLLGWIGQNREQLLMRAITILAAFCRAGRPPQGLRPYGSFEGWSSVVREAVVWVGLPDPCLTRTRLIETSDTAADALTQFIQAWELYGQGASEFVVSDLVTTLYPQTSESATRDEQSNMMRAALENLAGTHPGKVPGSRQLGNRLRRYRRRVVDGKYLDTDPTRSGKGMVWRVKNVGLDLDCVSDVSRVCFLAAGNS